MGWLGISLGAVVGAAGSLAAFKLLKVAPEPGLIGVAVVGGGLIGGALTAASAAADTGPTLHAVDLSLGAQTLSVKVGDVVDFTPPAGVKVTDIRTNNSDVALVASVSPATVNVVKAGGALLTLMLSTGEGIEVKLTTA
jgi:hypothetical protein